MVTVLGNGYVDSSSNLGRVCILLSSNILGKGINLIILPPAMCKLTGRLGFITLVWKPVLEKENSEFKPVKFSIKD